MGLKYQCPAGTRQRGWTHIGVTVTFDRDANSKMKQNTYMKSRFDGRHSPATKVKTQRALIPETVEPEPTKEDREMASTKNVIDHHLKCFGEGDLQGILSDYAPDAVLFTPAGPLRGEDAIRPLFQAMIAEFG